MNFLLLMRKEIDIKVRSINKYETCYVNKNAKLNA